MEAKLDQKLEWLRIRLFGVVKAFEQIEKNILADIAAVVPC